MSGNFIRTINSLLVFLLCLPAGLAVNAETMDSYRIGSHGQGNAKHPAWFKNSLLDLPEDLNEAREAGKRGLIVMFSQKNCSHCQAFIETTLNEPATQKRVKQQYDVIGLDIFSDNVLTTVDGIDTSVREYAETARARLTPTLIFYGIERRKLVKIIGFYPSEKFNRVLDYIEGGYYKKVKLSQYLRGSQNLKSENQQLVKDDASLFDNPPYQLDPSGADERRPLLVIFEQPNCSSCERFHRRVLDETDIRKQLANFKVVRLNASDNGNRLTTPGGTQLTPQRWSEKLQLNYDIASVFFDEQGNEVHRIDSECGRDRMAGSLQYVLEKAYLRHEQFLQWRKEQALNKSKIM